MASLSYVKPLDDCRVIQFKAGTKNKILTKHVIRSEQVLDKDICELKCYFEPNCVSYNFGPLGDGTFKCELSNRTRLQVSSSYFENQKDFIYRAIIVSSCQCQFYEDYLLKVEPPPLSIYPLNCLLSIDLSTYSV